MNSSTRSISVKPRICIKRLFNTILCSCAAWALLCASLCNPVALLSEQQHSKPTKVNRRALNWYPPHPEWRLKELIPQPACILPDALQKAGERANALYNGLKSFSAQEDIQFQTLGPQSASEVSVSFIHSTNGASDKFIQPTNGASYKADAVTNDFSRSYDYLVLYKQTPDGLVAQDSRTPQGASAQSKIAFDQDLGLTELALIFLPGMQTDYDFKCEGTVQRNGAPAWVLHFQQRKDRPQRTATFRNKNGFYPASLQGRAWIMADSGEIQHMETSMIDAIPEIQLEHWYLSINYAPVIFPPDQLRLLLPQNLDAYSEFSSKRTIAYHTFSKFKLFSVKVTLVPVD